MENLNLLGSQLILKVLSGEITSEEARRMLNPDPEKCVAGPHGVCVTHGQSLTDCEKDEQ